MRMPWQRRGGGRAGVDSTPAPEPTQHSEWRAVPPLQASIGARAPLTARSAELAEALSRRLRSTRERPPLVHRAGLPEPAAPGTVRGLATSARPATRARSERQSQDRDEEWGETASSEPGDARPAPEVPQHVRARRGHTGSLTEVDAALAALVQAPPEPRPAPRFEEPMQRTEEEVAAPSIPATPQHGLQRTVIRRRAGGPRPLGLQAPLGQENANATPTTAHDQVEGPAQLTAPEKPARAVAAAVGRVHRTDVGDVRIERGREAADLAAAAQARAVTRGGEVFIPASAGRLDTGRGAGLLAHELTHVIQQRRLGNAVPLEHSPAGRRLESDAAMTERHVRGDAGAAAPPPTASETPAPAPVPSQPTRTDDDEAATSTVQDIQDQLIASGRAIRMPDGSLVFPGSGAHLPQQRHAAVQPAVAMQRAPEDAAPADGSAPAAPESPAFAPGPGAGSFPTPDVTSPSSPPASAVPVPYPTIASVQPAPADAPGQPVPVPAASASPTETIHEPAAPIDLDDLARRVYGQVRTQLRSELLIDRERAGLLTDFR